MKVILLVVCLIATVVADCYLQNPRGSNDRLDEETADRQNANRMFNSQNNAAGGYCYGPPMSFYESSQLTVEWTVQHGCGNPKLYCNIVLQYMCGFSDDPEDVRLRDGTTTTTIDANDPNAPTAKSPDNPDALLFGLNEDRQYYQDCRTRYRNFGLFIADRAEEGNLNKNRPFAIFTRQQNDGTQYGFECPEERDYYPYWHPSPWKDIAILTNDKSYCDFYRQNSQNVIEKNYCGSKTNTSQFGPWNNKDDCLTNGGNWTSKPAWGLSAPECLKAQWSRDNHLGNGMSGYANTYNWTLPSAAQEPCINDDKCNCILRIRYNISTGELDDNNPSGSYIDWTKNAEQSPIKDEPYEDVGPEDDQISLKLAIDTTQFGRTFQDRSYIFHIKKRPDGINNARIFNLNVRGKRGNIVQTFPATEYDFVPEILYARVGDYIHFQWTGCDHNPNGFAGEGTEKTDRHNMVQIEDMDMNYPASEDWLAANPTLFDSPDLRKRMAFLDQINCLSYTELQAKHGANNDNDIEQDVQNCALLNAASPYFDGGLIRMNHTGEFYYMSTRNNNFSNRGQKGAIVVENLLPTWGIVIVVLGSAIFCASFGVGGAMLYAKSHPHSQVANLFSKM